MNDSSHSPVTTAAGSAQLPAATEYAAASTEPEQSSADVSARAATNATFAQHASYDAAQQEMQRQAERFLPRYLAVSVAVLVAWLYLVFGEFVLAGLPEELGWLFVVVIGVMGSLVLELQLTPYYRIQSRRERAANLLVAGLVCVALLLFSMILGVLLPEPLVTLLMFGVLAVLVLWERVKRNRLLPHQVPESTWVVTARLMVFGACTLAAVAKALGRI